MSFLLGLCIPWGQDGLLGFFKMLPDLTLYFCVYTLPTEGPHEHRLPRQLVPPTPEGPRKPPRGAFTGLWSGLWLDILSSLQPVIPRISTPLPPGLRSLTAGAKMFSVSKQTTQSWVKRSVLVSKARSPASHSARGCSLPPGPDEQPGCWENAFWLSRNCSAQQGLLVTAGQLVWLWPLAWALGQLGGQGVSDTGWPSFLQVKGIHCGSRGNFLGSFLTVIIFLILILYWSIVDLQCCVSFRGTAKWFSYTYTYICSFSDSFSIEVITECWVEFPALYSRPLLGIYFIYSSVYMLIPNS